MISGGLYHLDVMWLERHLDCFCLFGLSWMSYSDIIYRLEVNGFWIFVTLSNVGNFLTGTLLLPEDSPLLIGVKEYMFYLLEYLWGDLKVEAFLPKVASMTDLFDNALWCLFFDGVRISVLKF